MNFNFSNTIMNSPPARTEGPELQTPSPRKRPVRPSFTDPGYMASPGDSPLTFQPWQTAPPSTVIRQPPLASASAPLHRAHMAELQSLTDDHTMTDEAERPDLKRRRTAPASVSTLSAEAEDYSMLLRKPTIPPYYAKAMAGADSIWPEDIDKAFHDALRLVPKLGRRKVLVNGKPCGRNELVAEYIRRTTGKVRSRKQVSSHIQVLKNLRRNDPEFMDLVSEPTELDPQFLSSAAAHFFGGFTLCGPPVVADKSSSRSTSRASTPASNSQAQGQLGAPSPISLSAPAMTSSLSEGHLSPYSHGSFTLLRSPSLSSCASPLSQASDISRCGSPLASNSPVSATFTPGSATITSGMQDLQFGGGMGMPTVNVLPPGSGGVICPVLPDSMCLWADSDGLVDRMHVFAKLEKQRGPPALEQIAFEDVRDGQIRYPNLAAMHERLPCQFLHVKIDMCIPRAEDFDETLDNMHTQLNLKSTQELSLTAVTTIYSFGNELLSVQEDLNPAKRTFPTQETEMIASFADLESPRTASSNSSASSTTGEKHKWVYSAPFAADFWQIFLRGAVNERGDGPSYSKTTDDRSALETSINGLSIVQEYVVRSDDGMDISSERALSKGSAIGDVVLVVAYDFQAGEVVKPSTTVSVLSLKKESTPAANGLLAGVSAGFTVPPRVPSPLSHSSKPMLPEVLIETPARKQQGHSSPQSSPEGSLSSPGSQSSSSGDEQLPTPPNSAQKPKPSTQQRRAPHKPALSLTIPDVSLPLPINSALNTPCLQKVSTPTVPPAIEQPSSPTMRNRLGQIWAQTSGDWNMASPALVGSFPELDGSESSGAHPPALQAFTAQAIAAGTPTLAVFPSGKHGVRAGASPFMHPSSNFTNHYASSHASGGDYFSAYTSA